MARIAHLIAEFSAKEAMGRTIVETAIGVPGEHHCVTTRAHDGTAVFADVHELGGSPALFPLRPGARLAEVLDRIRPDLIHLHAGVLGTIQVAVPAIRRAPVVLTVYAWPTLPGPSSWRRSTLAELRASNVLAPRVALTTGLPPGVAGSVLRAAGVASVLTPDPRVQRRLAGRRGPRVVRLPSAPRWTPAGPGSPRTGP